MDEKARFALPTNGFSAAVNYSFTVNLLSSGRRNADADVDDIGLALIVVDVDMEISCISFFLFRRRCDREWVHNLSYCVCANDNCVKTDQLKL
jgi:hypothetical protein